MLISQSFLWVIDSLDPSLSAYPVLRFNIYPGPPFILYATLACWKFFIYLWHATQSSIDITCKRLQSSSVIACRIITILYFLLLRDIIEKDTWASIASPILILFGFISTYLTYCISMLISLPTYMIQVYYSADNVKGLIVKEYWTNITIEHSAALIILTKYGVIW